ncbi:MAG: Rossman fold protein, TIGR00730 family [Elusimicrobia bacterium RIFOXYA2_FULL_50_26]|nr:MAG: Rossman fold protein, TIGR00730 family [Elusimicrobia bacterium RIFOXYA2_FULL_50_26]OGS22873.1 MAG: Rossman fold protein, TIGR00730 family [Elusimicrobia bacterium RIFOXYB2_FULL_50_12]
MKRICVFCGSSSGNNERYTEAARGLGQLLARERIGLVYGGGGEGLMGEIAHTVLDNGGEVTGVIPSGLIKMEAASSRVKDMRIVRTMHQRKDVMKKLSDGFVALPGGLGTLEEFAEMLTWAQLGIHHKPCGLLNVEHYYDNLIAFLDHAMGELFLKPQYRALIMVEHDPAKLIKRFKEYTPPENPRRWID